MNSPGRCLIVAAALGLAASGFTSPALAFPSEAGGWTIIESGDACAMGMEFEGPGSSYLMLRKSAADELGVSIRNDNWSAKEGAEYNVVYAIGEASFGGATAIGLRGGFFSKFAPDFEATFAAGRTLHVYLDDSRIDQLSLNGTGAALLAVNQCLAGVRHRLAAERRERERWEHLPKDPFASPNSQAVQKECEATDAPPPAPVVPDLVPPAIAVGPKPNRSARINDDIAAPLRAAQAARPAIGGSESQFKQLFANWQKIECAAAPQKVP